MAWYNNLFGITEEKRNPAQMLDANKQEASREHTLSFTRAYEELEIVNRGVNMIVDDCAEIPTTVKPRSNTKGVVTGIKRSKVETLLNREPNPYQDINTFRRNLITDYLIDGNIFIYYDGAHMYHLPADKVIVHADSETYVSHYTLNDVTFSTEEIIHVKENSFHSIYRGVPRLSPAARTMNLISSMRKFQDNFFKNGAVPGLVLKSPNTLSDKIKERMILAWQQRYSPDAGGRRPLILQPELRDTSAYYTSLVNGGIISPAEARERMGFPQIDGTSDIRVPANIAGSAVDPSEGGRPTEEESNDE